MKNVVLISGSSRNGNTLGITKMYASAFEKKGLSTHIIDLSNDKPRFCDGCLECDETQQCKIPDLMGDAISRIKAADLVVIGTPARWSLLSGELKIFIDRLNPYASVEGYSEINVFLFAVGQSEKENGYSIESAIKSLAAFTTDAGMNLLSSQAFFELLDKDDYISRKSELEEICEENTRMLIERIDHA